MPTADTGYQLPVAASLFAANPGWLLNPASGAPAADLPVAAGTPVVAVTDGTISIVSGGQVVLNGSDGAVYTYTGLAPSVAATATVKAGTQLGAATGAVTFAINVPGVNGPVCPQEALASWSAGDTINVDSLPTSGCVDGQPAKQIVTVLVVTDPSNTTFTTDLNQFLSPAGGTKIVSVTPRPGGTLAQQIATGLANHPDLIVAAPGAGISELTDSLTAAGTTPVLWVDPDTSDDPAIDQAVSTNPQFRAIPVGGILAAAGGWSPAGTEAVAAETASYMSVAYGTSATPAATELSYAFAQLGRPYLFGGVGPAAYDCSGLTMMALQQVGVGVVHFAASQYTSTGPQIPVANLQPGDLVFFVGSDGTVASPGHEGIYVGGGAIIDAPYTGVNVRFDSLASIGGYVGATDPTSGLAVTADPTIASPAGAIQTQARSLVDQLWGDGQWIYEAALWQRESGWSATATNASSGAFGIAQALPPSKMASAGADWQTDPLTQVRWGDSYIAARYGTPEAAWAHELAFGWY